MDKFRLNKKIIHQNARKIIDNNNLIFAIDCLREVSDKRELRLYCNFYRGEVSRQFPEGSKEWINYIDRLNYAFNYSRTRSMETLGREWNPPSVI